MVSKPDSNAELERQHADIEAVFRAPRTAPDAGQPRVLAVFGYTESLRVINGGGLTSLDQATVDAVRTGARPGDPVPPREPGDYLAHVTGADVIITGSKAGRLVAVLFSHQHFPGLRFGHRNQLTEIQTAFLGGRRPPGAESPRVLTERAYGEARRVIGGGGWTGLDDATVEVVRGGAQPGDPLPPIPYINRVSDPEVRVTGSGKDRRVAILFSYRGFPGVRFGHRFPLDDSGFGKIWLKEEIGTGALDRMMETHPSADSAGITWTTWESEDD